MKLNSIYQTYSLRKYQASNHLDMLRGLCAIEVALSHIRNLLFVDYGQITNPNLLHKILYFCTGFGHQSVIVFFVLSGFFIANSILKSHAQEKWSWKVYLVSRLSRLQIVLIPALLLTYFWDNLGIKLLGENSVYVSNNTGANVSAYNIMEALSLKTLVGNLLFLQKIFVNTYGSNSALWSLTNEFWYYLLFPMLVLIFWPRHKFYYKIIYVIILGLLQFIFQSIILGFFIWLMGAIICIANLSPVLKNRKIWKISVGISCLTTLVILAAIRFNLLRDINISDFILGIIIAILIYILLHDQNKYNQQFYGKMSHTLSAFSYTLYLVHLPLVFFLHATLIVQIRWQPDVIHLMIGCLIFIGVIIYAWFFSQLTEAKTDLVRQKILFMLKSNQKIS